MSSAVTQSVQRRSQYISPATQSMSISVNGGTPTIVNLTPSSPNCFAPIGTLSEFSVTTGGSNPTGVAPGSDGNVWFTDQTGSYIGRITPSGTMTSFTTPTGGAFPYGIALGADNNLWFTERFPNKIGRITTAGASVDFAIPGGGGTIWGITSGHDGKLWFRSDPSWR
jgi:virginiamycin B lyase